MSVNSHQQRDKDVLLGKAYRTVLPPNSYTPGSDSDRLPSLVLENNKLPSLVPEILLSSLQKGHRVQLSKGNTVKQPEVLRVSTQSDAREQLQPVNSVDHRTVLPKLSSDPVSSQSQRRVVPPQGRSETRESPQQNQTDSRSSATLQTMARQEYEEELEFLKLKLRYMQNDIEFKQKQIKSAKMLKLKNANAANNWNQSNKNGSVQGGTFQKVHQTASSQVFPTQQQQSMLRQRPPAASEVSLPQMRAAASVLRNCSDLQGRNSPSSLPAAGNRFVMGDTGSKSLVTESNKSYLTGAESTRPSITVGISKSCESNKSSLVTERVKSSMGTDINKCNLATERKYGFAAENNLPSLVTECNKRSVVAEGFTISTAGSECSQLLAETTQECTISSANGRTVYTSAGRTVSSHTNAADVKHVNSVPPRPNKVTYNQTEHKVTEQTTSYPVDLSVAYGLNKEKYCLNRGSAIGFSASVGSGSPTSVFDRIGIQRNSEVQMIAPESPDKRIVVSSRETSVTLPAVFAASDLAQTVGHTSFMAVASEISTAHLFNASGNNIRDVSYSIGPSYVPHTEAHSDGDPSCNPHSVKPANRYKFVKSSPSYVNVGTSAASIVNSSVLPSSLDNFSSSKFVPNKDSPAASRGSQDNILSLQSVKPIPAAAEVVNRYKLKRHSPILGHQMAAQLSPVKMSLTRSSSSSSSVVHRANSQNGKTQPSFLSNYEVNQSLSNPEAYKAYVSKYNLTKAQSDKPVGSSSQTAPGVNSLAVSPLYDHNIDKNDHNMDTNDYNIDNNYVPFLQPVTTASSVVKTEAASSSLYAQDSMGKNYTPSIPPIMAAARRASQGSKFSLKNPNLKLHTAAKLVSKYKLKRLSPTLNLQTAPLFYNKVYKQSSLAYNPTSSKRPFQYSSNKLKLDRRLAPVSLANPQFGYKKISDLGSNSFIVLSQKHKIDRRPVVSHSSKITGVSLSSRKFTLDKRKSMDTVPVVKAASPVYAGKNVLDRRASKGGLFKSQVVSKQMTVDRQIGHSWTGPVAAGKVRPRAGVTSKYSWKKTCLPTAQSSRFKWSRPNVQAQSEAWQQLRQKLQLLLMKKHRHSRYNFFKYPTMAAASSAYNRRSQVGDYKTNLVTIDGITYKSSTRKLTRTRRSSAKSAVKRAVTAAGCGPVPGSRKVPQRQAMKLISLRGVYFHVDQSGKKLCRTRPVIPGSSADTKKSTSSHTEVNIVNFANRVIHRSRAIATAKYRKNNQKTKTPHCKFFSRFGKCHRGDSCPYVHDPEKVAVCTRFLRGRCDVKDCPFSHKASVNKMPVCLFFLRGSCSRDGCPYLHVRVNPGAPVCKDFRNGFCALGEKCKKIHSHVCPSFAMTGVCSRTETCTMLHRASKKEQEPPAQDKLIKKSNELATRDISKMRKSTITPNFKVPLAAQPSFISLGGPPEASVPLQVTASTQSVTSLGITPSFISLEAAPAPSFISLETAPAPSFISLEAAPAPSFISLEAAPAPSFISLEAGQHHRSTKSDLGDRKPGLAPQDSGSSEHGKSATRTLLNIRPSFMIKKMSPE